MTKNEIFSVSTGVFRKMDHLKDVFPPWYQDFYKPLIFQRITSLPSIQGLGGLGNKNHRKTKCGGFNLPFMQKKLQNLRNKKNEVIPLINQLQKIPSKKWDTVILLKKKSLQKIISVNSSPLNPLNPGGPLVEQSIWNKVHRRCLVARWITSAKWANTENPGRNGVEITNNPYISRVSS